jgi:hypothetical protein
VKDNPLKKIDENKSTKKDYRSLRKTYIPLLDQQYFEFCKKNDFSLTNEKSIVALKKEKKVYLQQLKKDEQNKFLNKISKDNKDKKFQKKINESNVREVINQNRVILNILVKLEKSMENDFIDIVLHLRKHWTKFNKRQFLSHRISATVWSVIYLLVLYKSNWIRDLKDFKVKGHNPHKIIYSLFCFLMVKHEIPKGLFSLISEEPHSILQKGKCSWDYLVKVANGGSPKEGIPSTIYIPKTQSSRLMRNLKKYEWNESLRRTQWQWLGLSESDQEDLYKVADFHDAGTTNGENIKLNFSRYISNQVMLDGQLFQQLWDYSNHLITENRDFSFKGRNVFNLIEGMEVWHRELYDGEDPKNHYSWEPSGLKAYKENRKSNDLKFELYMKELISTVLLNKEGKKQRHCVGSYAKNCKKGIVSIWSLRESIVEGAFQTLATVEVRGKRVVQARGYRNEKISSQARVIIERWAISNDLELAI